MGRSIEVLHPELKKKIEELKKRCSAAGLKIGISETWRTVEEQDKLYAKGRTEPGNIVTNARGSTYSSMHQWYIAFDFFRNDGKGAYNNSDGFFNKVGLIGETIGLEWGGNWKSFVDLPHFQLASWGSTPDKLKAQYKNPDNFKKSWSEVIEMNEKRYNNESEVPDWAKDTIRKIIEAGAIADKDKLDLSEDMLRVLVIADRLAKA